MKRGDYIGMKVNLVKGVSIPIEYLPGSPMLTAIFVPKDTFVVERDFRNSEESGIRVGFPNGSWAALTSEQFEELFGSDALARLDAIQYDEEVSSDGE